MGSNKNWREIFDTCDLDGDGQIDYNEFITAAMKPTEISNEMIEKAFNILDYDGNGEIDASELQYAFKQRGSNANAKKAEEEQSPIQDPKEYQWG